MKKIKVCIVSVSLAKGGLERSCANLSILLSDYGYEVQLVTLNDDVDYAYKGTLFNLGKYKTETDTPLKRILRFRRLRRYFRTQKFDYILDNRVGNQAGRELYYMLYIYGVLSKVIYVQHSGRLETHFPEKSLSTRLLIQYANSFIGVSQGITDEFNNRYSTNKCHTIYNYKKDIEALNDDYTFPEKYILFLGRLDEKTKNLSLLLEAYNLSDLPSSGVKLLVMGDGPDKKPIQAKVDAKQLTNSVIFRPFTSTIYGALSQALVTVLTSRNEGFPMVLVESLSCGTPVIAVDCETGPREIIENEVNGLLVENHNPQVLSEAMNRMINDEKLYLHCKRNAKESVMFLNRDIIAKKWVALLK